VSSGKGATTCAHFLPGDQELIYASVNVDGAELERITDAPGFDGFPMFRPMASGWRPHRTAPLHLANTTPTSLAKPRPGPWRVARFLQNHSHEPGHGLVQASALW